MYRLTLNKRAEYLSMAVSNSKSSTSSDSSLGPAADLLAELPDRLEVVKLQMEVYRTISELSDAELQGQREALLATLDSRLFILDDIYHHFVEPLGLDEITLQVLYVANYGAQGRAIAEGAWRSLVERACATAEGRDMFEVLASKVQALGRRFYPNENVFPLRRWCWRGWLM